jgi:Raf kinase inhibitor-like YbhB/YbcL family protein
MSGLEEAVPNSPELASGARQAANGFKKAGYGGPCPPAGKAHHYVFTLYALDVTLDTANGAGKNEILEAMKGHVLGQGELTGLYQR